MNKLFLIIATLYVFTGCIRSGTVMSISVKSNQINRAIDQEVLSGAIDLAFENIKLKSLKKAVGKFTPPPRGIKLTKIISTRVASSNEVDPQNSPTHKKVQVKTERIQVTRKTMSAYVEVSSVAALPPNLRRYVEQKASSIAAKLNMRIFEVNERFQTPATNQSNHAGGKNATPLVPFIEKTYPDTDAKIIISISYMGVDEERNEDRRKNNANKKAYNSVIGRFKAELSIIPRQASFKSVSQVISGEKSYQVGYGNYLR